MGPDGSVYAVGPKHTVVRLDPATGAVRNTSLALTTESYDSTKMAVDATGQLFVSNGNYDTGALFAFDPDLTLRWSVPVNRIALCGPALAQDGTLVVAGAASLSAYHP